MTTTSNAQPPFHRLLLTGAAGGLGKVLRERLQPLTEILRLSDIAEMAPAEGPHIEVQLCDLADKQAVHQLVEGCLLYTSPSPRDLSTSRMPSSA